jgi:hypothetical protein
MGVKAYAFSQIQPSEIFNSGLTGACWLGSLIIFLFMISNNCKLKVKGKLVWYGEL